MAFFSTTGNRLTNWRIYGPSLTVQDPPITLPMNNPAGGVESIPTTASLTITRFAPTVVASDHTIVTPGIASLTLTAFVPVVVASDHHAVTPGAASLVVTPFTPSVTASDHRTAIPGTASLTLTAFAPMVEGSMDAVPVGIIGGDDAPRTRRTRTKEAPREHFFTEVERTIHQLLHPEERVAARETPASVGTDDVAGPRPDEWERHYDTLVGLAQASHESLHALGDIRRDLDAYLEARRADDEEDELILML